MASELPGEHVRTPIRVTVAAEDAELAADRLFAADASAVSELPRDDGAVDLLADPDPAALDELIEYFGRSAVHHVDGPDPAATWQEHAEVVAVGERLVVRPDWLPAPALDPRRLEIVVAAAEAFGSGGHATTRLCLEALEPLVEEGMTVLDVGSGSGVLAVAAALLGAAEVQCHDITAEAVAATRRSAELSGVGARIVATLDPVDVGRRGAGYDLVLANLLIPIIEELGAVLVASVAPAGHLVVSGVLQEQLERAVAACAPLEVVDTILSGDWVALVLRRVRECERAVKRHVDGCTEAADGRTVRARG